MSTPTTTAPEDGASPTVQRDSLFTRLYTGAGAFGIVPNRRRSSSAASASASTSPAAPS